MEQKNSNYGLGMGIFGAVFFIFGFATTFIITMTAPVKAIFNLSEWEAQLLSSAFFISYPILSIPSGKLVARIGYKWTVVLGLLLMGVGSLIFWPAARIPSFPMFLLATFILAAGVVLLQVAANPYVTALGPESSASSRLNLTQALNSVATMIAPWIISVAIFRGLGIPADESLMTPEHGMAAAQRVPVPFITMAIVVIAVAVILLMLKLPVLEVKDKEGRKKSVWKYPHVILGAFAIFAYVGAEVGNAGLIVNYLRDSAGIDPEKASTYAAIYWGGAMVGRFFGAIMFSGISNQLKKYSMVVAVLILALISGAFVTADGYSFSSWNFNAGQIFMLVAVVNFIIMQIGKGKAARTLGVFALVAAALALITTFTTGDVALWTVISIGLFNSIMFPNIFSLGVKDLDGEEMASASGIINSFVVGGAVIPLLMGAIADATSYTWAFVVPAICYLYIFFYAVKGHSIRTE
ncbi:MFS transporter [Thermophagus xiamenensis]|uniref:MFS transporter, FHS family, L-fucose permease n=1 Tax=Thermophagus xiamenensis TaxID=385682 RepID=A0A1I2EFW1_9BACT|nr:MFS transporter [Thermophagus xiamenensis]SFE91140.1 MFS transporter, FHS family, L-fucose permease [Thermophagus xiamenensis]